MLNKRLLRKFAYFMITVAYSKHPRTSEEVLQLMIRLDIPASILDAEYVMRCSNDIREKLSRKDSGWEALIRKGQ